MELASFVFIGCNSFESRARLSQEWAQGLMYIRAPILNHPKNLNIFDALCEHINQCW